MITAGSCIRFVIEMEAFKVSHFLRRVRLQLVDDLKPRHTPNQWANGGSRRHNWIQKKKKSQNASEETEKRKRNDPKVCPLHVFDDSN